MAEAQAESLLQARRDIAQISRERITEMERGEIAGVDRIVQRSQAVKKGATTVDEIPVLEAEVADLERQLKQLEGSESVMAQVDELVKLANTRARAAEAAANCRVKIGRASCRERVGQ